MVILLYSNKNYEHQAIACIKSFESKITDDVKILYFTIGFNSEFQCKNLYKKEILNLGYSSFNYYKAELSLKALEYFPDEQNFIFTDTDVLFSKRFNPSELKHNYEYPLAGFGPHEYPFIYEYINGEMIVYNEVKMMQYFNVPIRSQRYVFSCFYTFNRSCIDFLEEFTSICKNEYLQKYSKYYFPFKDETPFNICLWKRNADKNLGFNFVNTHLLSTVKLVEENNVKEVLPGTNLDSFGADWEYIQDSSKVILYHGFKDESHINPVLEYLINNK